MAQLDRASPPDLCDAERRRFKPRPLPNTFSNYRLHRSELCELALLYYYQNYQLTSHSILSPLIMIYIVSLHRLKAYGNDHKKFILANLSKK